MLHIRSVQQSGSLCSSIDSPQLANIISYPSFNNNAYLERITELKTLGVESIMFGGRSLIGKVAVMGKGCVGLVLRAETQNHNTVALKVRRIDANRTDMKREAELQKIANLAGVGPEIFGYTKNIILMGHVEGLSIINWIKQDDNISDRNLVLKVISDILEQCYLLDEAHLDHGQLSNLDHHVIISEALKVTIIDFESSSTQRKISNVTSAIHSLLLSGFVARRITDSLSLSSLQNYQEMLIQALKLYKLHRTRECFDRILHTLLEGVSSKSRY